jgi:electron transfer flavoprotein alpha subunit
MSDLDNSEQVSRLRLIDSLLAAAGESVTPFQHLLAEVRRELARARQDEDQRSSRDEEVDALRREVEQLKEGMISRAVIERAKGILMQADGLTETEAFALLTDLSQRRHRKLRDIAADVVAGTAAAQATGPAEARPHLVPGPGAPLDGVRT